MKFCIFPCNKKVPQKEYSDIVQAQFVSSSKLEEVTMSKPIYLVLLLSYAQIFFQTMQILRKNVPDPGQYSLSPYRTFEDIFTFENLFTYSQPDSLLIFTSFCIAFYFIITIVSFSIVLYKSYKSTEINCLMSKLWSLLLQFHGSVVFFPINNLCNRIQEEFLSDNLAIFNVDDGRNKIVFSYVTIIFLFNIAFTVFPHIFLFDILPSKSLLSSKTSTVDKVILIQKFFLSFLRIFLFHVDFLGWILVFLQLVFSLIRHLWFLYILPRYHLRTLLIDFYLISICSLSSLLGFIVFILNRLVENPVSFSTFLITVLVLIPLTMVCAQVSFKKNIEDIIFKPYEKLNHYKALHKIMILKFMKQTMKPPSKLNQKIEEHFFWFSIIQRRLENSLATGNNDFSPDINLTTKEDQTQISRRYLESLAKHFNRSDEIKLILARFYAKKANLLIIALKTLAKIKSRSNSIRVSALLLKLQIQEKILRQSQSKEAIGVDLNHYFTVLNHKEGFKELLKNQLDYQNIFWKEYSKNEPDIQELQRVSKMIDEQKRIISKRWTLLESQGSQVLSTFYSLYGRYQILLNDSISQGKMYFSKYKIFNARLASTEHELTNSILLDKNNVSITIKTTQDKIGVVLDCSNSIKKALGYEKQEIIGSNVNSIMSRFIGQRHNKFIESYIETGQSTFLGKMQSLFAKNKSGSVQKISLWVGLHPFLKEEILLTGIFQVVDDPKEYIFITPEGEIDSHTEKIGLKLGILGKKMHITSLCRNLNSVFSVQNPELYQNTNTENYRVTSEDALLQQSTRRLNTREKYTFQTYFSTKQSFDPLNFFKLKEEKVTCKLNFDACAMGHKSPGCYNTHEYECELRNVYIKEVFMTMIEIEMNQDKKTNIRKGVISKLHLIKTKTDNEDGYGTIECSSPAENHLQNSVTGTENSGNENVKSSQEDENKQIQEAKTVQVRKTEPFLTKKGMLARKQLSKLGNKEEKKLGLKHFQDIAQSSASLKDEKLASVEDLFEEKYYPKTVKIFLAILLAISLGTLLSEVFFQIKIKRDLQYSKALAATTSLATTRADALSQIARSGRASYSAQSGFAGTDATLFKGYVNLFMGLVNTYVPVLRDTNAALQFAIADIDEVFQEKFKSVDVRIYDINPDYTVGSYQKFDTFSALSILIQKVLKAKNHFFQTGSFDLQDLYYILVNSVNDVLEKTLSAIDIVAENTNLSFLTIIEVIRVSSISVLCLLSMAIIIICGFVSHIYISEIRSLQIFLGLSPQDIQAIRERLDCFEGILQNDKLGEVNEFELNPPAIKRKETNFDDRMRMTKPHKAMKRKGLQRLYLKKSIICFFILIAYMAGIYFSLEGISNRVETLRKKVIALTKTQSVLYQTSMLTFSIGKVIAGDKIGKIRNLTPEEAILSDLNNYWKISYELLEAFKEQDGTYDPLIAPFFFEDSCQFIISATPKSQCVGIVKEAKSFGLLSLFSFHYRLNLIMYQDFKAVNNPNFATYSYFIARLLATGTISTAVIREMILIMIQTIKDHLQELWMSADTYIYFILSLDPIFLLIIGLITWKYLLKHFTESWNRLKRMMRIVPFPIILKNPTLKVILLKCSKGKLEKLNMNI